MSEKSVQHDYHLVKPSPWPFLASFFSVVLALGFIAEIKGIFGIPKGNWSLLAIAFAGLFYILIGWWSDVVKEANAGDHTAPVSLGLRYGMSLFIVSEVMFFVGWFWIFFEMAIFHGTRTHSAFEEVRAAWAHWPPKGVETLDPWHFPLINTVILLTSGTSITWAHHAILHNNRKETRYGLILTIVLGLLFTTVQAYEYREIIAEKLFFNPQAISSGLYGSSFFMATGFHGFHVIVGTLFLIVCLFRLLGGGFTAKQHFGLEAAAWYWHFVDVVWLFLFAFIYVAFRGSGH